VLRLPYEVQELGKLPSEPQRGRHLISHGGLKTAAMFPRHGLTQAKSLNPSATWKLMTNLLTQNVFGDTRSGGKKILAPGLTGAE
jgi:hypothetical protein